MKTICAFFMGANVVAVIAMVAIGNYLMAGFNAIVAVSLFAVMEIP